MGSCDGLCGAWALPKEKKPTSQHSAPFPCSYLQVPKKKDNLSPEMRARLKQEYVGLGGSANSVSDHY